MALVFKSFFTLFTYLTIVQDVYLLPMDLNLNNSRTDKNQISSIYKKSGDVLVRIRKESVRIGSCPKEKERYKGRCRTQKEAALVRNNTQGDECNPAESLSGNHSSTLIERLRDSDYDDNVTEPAVYEVVPLSPKRTIPYPEIVQEDDLSTSTVYDTETSTVALLEVTETQLVTTETTLNVDAKEIHGVSPTLVFEDKNGADSERLNNLTYTFLIVLVAVVVLIWLFKLLYNYLRREDDAVSHSCSKDEVCDAMSSQCRLCS